MAKRICTCNGMNLVFHTHEFKRLVPKKEYFYKIFGNWEKCSYDTYIGAKKRKCETMYSERF